MSKPFYEINTSEDFIENLSFCKNINIICSSLDNYCVLYNFYQGKIIEKEKFISNYKE